MADDARQALNTLLESLGESSSFATSGSAAAVLPGLEIRGLGPIGAPVSQADFKRLVSKATQAPYGRGAERIGREGVSMDRWYRQGVIVIWPRDRTFEILASEGQASALPELERMVHDCLALSQFLRDPAARVGRFPLRKDRRQHLHQQIERHGCEFTHVTERKGLPQTLVCTKTQGSYERRLKQYEVDKKLLAELEASARGKGRGAMTKRSGRQTAKRRRASDSLGMISAG